MRGQTNRVVGVAAALLVLLGSPATSMAASSSASKVRPHQRPAAATRRPPKPRGFLRKMLCRRDCARRRAGAAHATSTAVAPRPAPPAGPRRFTSAAELPRPRFGMVRLYRGTGHPDRVQVSRSLRGRPASEVPRGDRQFFDLIRGSEIARLHAQGAETHPDAVSMTSDLSTATSVARSHDGAVMVYDLPAALVDRLPRGDRTMGEVIIKYSIPTDYLIGVIPAPRRR
jgi:hypothetical protein